MEVFLPAAVAVLVAPGLEDFKIWQQLAGETWIVSFSWYIFDSMEPRFIYQAG